MTEINVCISCDDNYAKYASVVIASILSNAANDDLLHFYILDGKISSENKKKMLSIEKIKPCKIESVAVDENKLRIYKQINTHEYITLPTYYRLILSELLPDVDKIIYLDCDTVVNTSLKDLFETDFSDNIIAGVLDARVKHKTKWKNSKYINAGMVVFDLEKIRNGKIEQKFAEYTKNNPEKIETGDQDIINYTLEGRIKILPDEWNVQVSGFASRTSFTKHPKIIHYIGYYKPWVFGSCTFFKDLYFKYLQITPWALTEEEQKYWYDENKKTSRLNFWKKRPFCFLNPKYWYVFYCSYIKQ